VSWARDEAGGAVLEVLVQPRASRTRAVGELAYIFTLHSLNGLKSCQIA
jgi:hypothetical protein